jgi:hypothetical protein
MPRVAHGTFPKGQVLGGQARDNIGCGAENICACMEPERNSGIDRTERKRELYKSLLLGLLAFIVVFALFRLFWK